MSHELVCTAITYVTVIHVLLLFDQTIKTYFVFRHNAVEVFILDLEQHSLQNVVRVIKCAFGDKDGSDTHEHQIEQQAQYCEHAVYDCKWCQLARAMLRTQ